MEGHGLGQLSLVPGHVLRTAWVQGYRAGWVAQCTKLCALSEGELNFRHMCTLGELLTVARRDKEAMCGLWCARQLQWRSTHCIPSLLQRKKIINKKLKIITYEEILDISLFFTLILTFSCL